MLGDILTDLLGEAVVSAISDSFLALVGFGYLYGRYWHSSRVHAILVQQYDSRYATAGAAVTNNLMQIIGVLLLLVFWIGILIVVSHHGWS